MIKINRLMQNMMLGDKRGMMKTLEAFIAISMILIFVLFMLARSDYVREESLGIIKALVEDDNFRGCITIDNTTCAEQVAREYIPGKYSIKVFISINPDDAISGLPKAKTVYSESAFISGNTTVYNPRIVRVYYWEN